MVVVSSDPIVLRQVAAFARERDLCVAPPDDGPAAAVVVDLAGADAMQVIRHWRARCPEALIVGCHSLPDRARLEEAERAGCDAVGNRGALSLVLRRLAGSGPLGRRRTLLADLADVAGRLGMVVRVADTPVGPVALYQLDGRLVAACDVCPHAGARLSDGALDATVVTCPSHGSRFDLSNGERIRGPADHDLATYDVLIEGGRVYMSWTRTLR